MLEHCSDGTPVPKRAVVIGARGVLGTAIMADLANHGVPVLALGSREIDLLEAGATEKLAGMLGSEDTVVMLSALTPDKGRDTATFMKNLRMAEAVCAAIKSKPPAHIVYMSSDAVYPMTEGLVSEQSAAMPPDLYGTMHYAREVMFRDAAGEVPLAVLRSTLVLSPRDTHNSYGPNRFRRLARDKGEIVLGGEGEETRDHVLDADVAAIVRHVLVRRSRGILNIATGNSHSFRQVAELVAGRFDRPVAVNGSPRNAPATYRRFDVTALRQAFPDFRFTSLADAIAKVHAETGDG